MKIYIYTLEHPDTNEIRYIGKTSNLKRRYYHHTNKKEHEKNRRYLSNWLNNLFKQDKKPIISILEECDENSWVECEKFWIEQFKNWGFKLVNGSEGGDGNLNIKLSNEHKTKIASSSIKKCPITNLPIHSTIDFETASKIKNDLLNGKRGIDIARKYNTTQHTVYLIKCGKKFPDSGITSKIEKPKIGQYDLENNLIQAFDSIRDAAKSINGCYGMIRYCLKKPNIYKTYKKYKWKFIN